LDGTAAEIEAQAFGPRPKGSRVQYVGRRPCATDRREWHAIENDSGGMRAVAIAMRRAPGNGISRRKSGGTR
jgi:hypothetical protein